MINSNELRLGNIVKNERYFKEWGQHLYQEVVAIECGKIKTNKYEWDEPYEPYFNPVELTPEVLLAAGFQNFDNTWIIGRISEWEVHLMKYGFVITHETCDPRIWNIPINTLHDVQNAIFALTGTELEIDITKI